MLLAIGIAVVTGFSGVYASFFLDSAPGPTIVVIYAALFVLAFLYVTVKDRRTQHVHG
jgi:manganese/iron transport system permease protein